MSYTGEDVRRDAEAYRAEMAQCDKVRKDMMQDFIARIKEQNKKKRGSCADKVAD